jgi:hypothetical protein
MVESVEYAHHNILHPYVLGPKERPGASAWHELFADAGTMLQFVLNEGLPAGASAGERDALRTVLLRYTLLYVNSEQQLGAAEMARLRDARKIENAKQRKACPSLADVPWLQRLLLESGTTMDPYDMGRRLAVALRVDDTQVQGADLAGLGRRLSVTAGIAAVTAVKDNIREGNMAGMWMSLQAFQRHVTYVIKEEYNEARALAVLYPQCVLITELCAGRDQQVCQLPVMFEQMTKVFTDAATQSGDTWLLGCWDSFFEGFEVKNTATAAVHAGIMLRGQAVLDGSGGSPGAKGGPGGAISGGGGTVQTRGAAAPQGAPAAPGKTPGGGGAGGAGGSGGGGAGAGAGPGPTAGATNLKIQKHAPVSAAIIGAHMGSAAPASI